MKSSLGVKIIPEMRMVLKLKYFDLIRAVIIMTPSKISLPTINISIIIRMQEKEMKIWMKMNNEMT